MHYKLYNRHSSRRRGRARGLRVYRRFSLYRGQITHEKRQRSSANGVSMAPSCLDRQNRRMRSSVRRRHFARLLCCKPRRWHGLLTACSAADLTPFCSPCEGLRSLGEADPRPQLGRATPCRSDVCRSCARTHAPGISTAAVAGLRAFSNSSLKWPPGQPHYRSRPGTSRWAVLTPPRPAMRVAVGRCDNTAGDRP